MLSHENNTRADLILTHAGNNLTDVLYVNYIPLDKNTMHDTDARFRENYATKIRFFHQVTVVILHLFIEHFLEINSCQAIDPGVS